MADENPALWRAVADEATLQKLRNNPRFHHLLTLGRIGNSVRFAVGAAFDRDAHDTPGSTRQRTSSFLYLCALLHEGLNFTQRLGKHFRESPAFQAGLARLLQDSSTKSLREGLLKRLRNQAVYHHDDEVMARALRRLRMPEYVFVSGTGYSGMDVYYNLSEICLLLFGLEPDLEPTGQVPFLAQLEPVIEEVLLLGARFAQHVDELTVETLDELGWNRVSETEAHPQ